jgi:hypothetical protein
MDTFQIESDEEIILVEFEESGLQTVSNDPQELLAKSQMAIARSMSTVRNMAKRAVRTIQSIPVSERPSRVEFQFGIKMNGEAGAMIAKVSAEAALNVTMTWEHKAKSE